MYIGKWCLFLFQEGRESKMTILTAYNKDVQRYFQGSNCNKIRKETIISAIEERVFEMGQSFSKLFPTKKAMVLDEIVFLLSGTGICKIGAEKLAEKVGCSVRTVKGAVASIKETDEILVARLADKKAGKYIFVYKQHPNFKEILREVFFIDSLPESEENALPVAPQFAPLQNAVPPEAVGLKGENQSSNHINFFNSLQEKEFIQQSIENDVQNSGKNQSSLAEQREKIVKYGANENQLWFFDMVSGENLPEQVKTVVGILALRLGMDTDRQNALKGYRLAFKIALNIRDGVRIESVPAVFSDGLNKPLNSYATKEMPAPKPTVKKVKFYNWLED